MMSRAERTLLGEWWWTIDRTLMFALFGLMLIGLIMTLAASPAVAVRQGSDMFFFINKQATFMVPAALVMIGTSFLSPKWVRRLALAGFFGALLLVWATLFFGAEIKGSRRWISLVGFSLQPSEFLKPCFIVLSAWLFSESTKRTDMPANLLAIALLAMAVTPVVMQPDVGQTMLMTMVWAGLFFMAGMRWIWVGGLVVAGVGGLGIAYKTFSHVRKRIDKFMQPDGESFQVEIANNAFEQAGWFGKGPGEGTMKRILPDSHTDYVFAVAAEEFGIIVALLLVLLFAFIVLRALMHAYREEDPFCRFAISGLAMLFGLQCTINLMVNLHLLPPKGMTLPFISYGGSSLVALAFGMGMLLALTRRRPRAEAVAGATYHLEMRPA